MAAPNRRSFLQLLGCCVSCGLLLVILLGLTLWAAGALFFMLPFKEARGLSAAIYVIAVLGLLLRIRCSILFRHEPTVGDRGDIVVGVFFRSVGQLHLFPWHLLVGNEA